MSSRKGKRNFVSSDLTKEIVSDIRNWKNAFIVLDTLSGDAYGKYCEKHPNEFALITHTVGILKYFDSCKSEGELGRMSLESYKKAWHCIALINGIENITFYIWVSSIMGGDKFGSSAINGRIWNGIGFLENGIDLNSAKISSRYTFGGFHGNGFVDLDVYRKSVEAAKSSPRKKNEKVMNDDEVRKEVKRRLLVLSKMEDKLFDETGSGFTMNDEHDMIKSRLTRIKNAIGCFPKASGGYRRLVSKSAYADMLNEQKYGSEL